MNSKSLPFKVKASKVFEKTLSIPTSKSHANRAIIIGALRGQNFKVHHVPESTDVQNLIACLETMGLLIERAGTTITFKNSFPACENDSVSKIIDLKTGDGGTTNRFLMALCARGKKTYRFFPAEKMSERPMDDLIDPLKLLEVKIDKDADCWLKLQGPATMINTSVITVNCHKSTQFASAMRLAFSNLPLTIKYENVDASQTYLEMTEHILSQTLKENMYTIPADFSSLGYPAALAALQGKLLVTNSFESDRYQADSVFMDLLMKCGANVEWLSSGLCISQKNKIQPFNFSVKHAPDLFPTLAFLAAHSTGDCSFTDLDILKHKESDRLTETIRLLESFKVKFKHSGSTLTITGAEPGSYPRVIFNPPRDHRMVMAAYLFMRVNNGGDLYEHDCVEKSFPHFFKALE